MCFVCSIASCQCCPVRILASELKGAVLDVLLTGHSVVPSGIVFRRRGVWAQGVYVDGVEMIEQR